MRKLTFLLFAAALAAAGGVRAQAVPQPVDNYLEASDSYLFTHLGAGLSLGTDGIGLELATPVTPYLGLRAGVNFFPSFTLKFHNVDYARNGKNGEGDVRAKFKKVDGKVLLDIYPFGHKVSFHVTAGAFFGNDELVKLNFAEDPNAPLDGGIIPKQDNPNKYIVEPDEEGIIRMKVMTKAVKPYVGIGFGRMVPKANKRIGVSCDIGVQFHGTPTVKAYAPEVGRYLEISSQDFGNDFSEGFRHDVDKALDAISKVKVWPVLNIRLTGRIF